MHPSAAKILVPGLVFSGAALIITALYAALPYLLNNYVIPYALQDLPFKTRTVKILSISPSQTTATAHFATEDGQSIKIARLEMHYSINTLLQKEIERLAIDTISVTLRTKDGQISTRNVQKEQHSSPEQLPRIILPVDINMLTITNGEITINDTDSKSSTRFFTTDAQITLITNKTDSGKYLLQKLQLGLNNRPPLAAKIIGSMTFQKSTQQIKVTANIPDISPFPALLQQTSDLQATGTVLIDATLKTRNFNTIDTLQAAITLTDFSAGISTVQLQSSPEGKAKISLAGIPGDLQYRAENFSVSVMAKEKIECAATGTITAAPVQIKGSLQLATPHAAQPSILHHELTLKPEGVAVTYDFDNNSYSINKFKLKDLKSSGKLRYSNGITTGNITLQSQQVTTSTREFAIHNIWAQLPFEYPFQGKKQQQGTLQLRELRYRNNPLASLEATFTQKNNGIDVVTETRTPFFADYILQCRGNIRNNGNADLGCTVPPFTFESTKLPDYVPFDHTASISARLSAKQSITRHNKNLSGNLEFNIEDGSYHKESITIAGINGRIEIPRLPQPFTSPSQQLAIDSVTVGDIQLSNGKIDWRFQEGNALFLEKAQFNWCGGSVETAGLTLAPETKDLTTTLYCDRINFSQLLSQFGIEGAEGDGSLNGKLPLRINTSGIYLDDGFLFSTPGNSGIVRFRNNAQLQQGVAALQQTAYLDYTVQSLENFAYNWVKLHFRTKGRDLLLGMQLDGKPASPLPYGYKNGHIVKTNKAPGLQHPIRLDVNFHLPLQEILEYGTDLQSLMENM